MYPRINYEMTQAQLDKILDACKPTPVMFLAGGRPMGGSPQENANAAWAALGRDMGFDHMTVQPQPMRGHRFFSAVPSENETQRDERLKRETEKKRLSDIAELQSEIAAKQATLAALQGAP